MARVEQKAVSKRKSGGDHLPFTKVNYQILGAGILLIVLGYVALAQSPWDGTMPLVVAPILLVAGYCIVIPFGILYRRKADSDSASAPGAQPSAPKP